MANTPAASEADEDEFVSDQDTGESSDGEEEPSEAAIEARRLVDDANALLEASEETGDPAQHAAALALFEQALVVHPDSVEAHLGKAFVLGLQESYDAAFAALAAATAACGADDRISEMHLELSDMQREHEADLAEMAAEGVSQLDVAALDEEDDEATPDTASPPENKWHLLFRDGTMTKQFYLVLRTVFAQFDADGDGAWNLKELDRFHQQVNGEPASSEFVKFVRGALQTNSKGNLVFEGLLQLFANQAAGDVAEGSEETWKDLKSLGFDEQLRQIDDRYKSKAPV
jgi:hypothetical protein